MVYVRHVDKYKDLFNIPITIKSADIVIVSQLHVSSVLKN